VQGETLAALLAYRCASMPDAIAAISAEGELTFAALDAQSRERAAWLVAQGVNKTHCLALVDEDSLEWIVSACAAMRIGAVLVPLATGLPARQLQALLALTGARHLIASDQDPGSLEIDRNALPSLCSVWNAAQVRSGAPTKDAAGIAAALEARVVPADDIAILVANDHAPLPAAVVHTHGPAVRSIAALTKARGAGPGQRLALAGPLHRREGFGTGLIAAIAAGAALDLGAQETVPQDIGPAPLCGLPVDGIAGGDKAGSLGKALDGFRLRVADPRSGAILSAGTSGMIELGGHNLMRAICGLEREQVFTSDGWFPTGLAGRIDADGFVWFDEAGAQPD
jgi:acyl-CoA synthetase (AMP-forming)/AMP-acid ligase II